jgi:mRNA-degrading endonuclease RelE of RelBE toxin-antitoxin system
MSMTRACQLNRADSRGEEGSVKLFGGIGATRRRLILAVFAAGMAYISRRMTPFQIIFNPTSAAELSRMPKELQLTILGEFRGLPHEAMSTDLSRFGKMQRGGKTIYRFRIGDYRIYFERHDLGIVVHRILNRHSLKDFLYRNPTLPSEDEALEQNPKFWELIETARASYSKR